MARKENVLQRSKKKKAQTLLKQGQFEQARKILEQLTCSGGSDPEVWFTLGAINGRLGSPQQAIECCRKALKLKPNYVAAQYNLAIALRDNGQMEDAVRAFRDTLRLRPDHQEAMSALGNALVSLSKFEEAETVFRTGLKHHPDDPEFYACLGSAMQTMGRLEAAVSSYKKAIAYKSPELAAVFDNLGSVFCQQGKYRESLEYYNKALKEKPGDPRIHSNVLLTMHYSTESSEAQLFQEHKNWLGNRIERCSTDKDFSRGRGDSRRIRVGYVSSDFREHSVTYFIEPVLENHDHETFEIHCYHNSDKSDVVTKRLCLMADHWTDTVKMTDEQLFTRIQADEIDILVDLNGHTAGNRLTVFAMKPAPLQVSYLGYPNTTGLSAMDYRLTSCVADPQSSQKHCVEKLCRLEKTFLCYRAPSAAPEVSASPAQENGVVTFGSFNNLAKINLEVIDLWSELLRAMPGARLLIKNPSLTDETTRERYLRYFMERGIDANRIELLGFARTTAEHLSIYGRIDIALDTFPYNGTTTSCEALWMGVPVVTLAGHSHRARVGASILAALNRPEWIADSGEQFVSILASLAGDISGLASIRAGLRNEMSDSPLCDARSLVKEIETLYSSVWADWCDKAGSSDSSNGNKGPMYSR